MTEQEIVKEHCPLCVNIRRLEAYLLADDEVILFDWLTIKQSLVFGYKPFYYSLERIMKETRLKRRRIERVIKRFCAMGILQIEVCQKADELGRVRYFRMDFGAVIPKLKEIIDQDSDFAPDFDRYFNALKNIQNRAENGKESKREREDREHAEELYEDLNTIYASRIDMFNTGKLTEDKPKRKKTMAKFPKNRSIIARIKALAAVYDDDTIKNSFIVVCDDTLKGELNPQNIIRYFLSYDKEGECYNVVEYGIAKFQIDYSCDR